MPPTKRERLEALQQQIQKTVDAWEDRDMKGVTQAEAEVLHVKTTEARQLRKELDAELAANPVHHSYRGVSPTALGMPGSGYDGSGPLPTSRGGWSAQDGFASKGSGPWAAEMKNFLDRIGSKALVPSGTITVPSISATITSGNDRPRNILSLMTFQKLENTNSFSYLKETVRTHAASTVEAGSLKPTSVYSVAKVEDRVRVIASLSEPVDRSLLMDVALLQQYLEGALKEGVMLELEDQVINGAGSTTGVLDDMTGILASSPTAQVFGTDKLTTARKALTTLQAQNLDPSGFAWAMAPSEWESLELLTSATEYVMGDPGRSGSTLPIDQARMSLWGVPVVTSTVIPTGFALLGDFGGSAVIFEREGVRIDWSDAVAVGGVTGFESNQITFRAEGRWGLAVTRPAGFVYADLVA